MKLSLAKPRTTEGVAQSCTLLYRGLAVRWAGEVRKVCRMERKPHELPHGPGALSLTPCFSWVFHGVPMSKLFQQFRAHAETVETVPAKPASFHTQLKQGVNERGAFHVV
jgi:hypothetical protein